jgi:hypothetical protein
VALGTVGQLLAALRHAARRRGRGTPAMTAPAARLAILTRDLLLVFAASLGAMTGFYLLLSVVPLYAESVGAGGVGPGLSPGP